MGSDRGRSPFHRNHRAHPSDCRHLMIRLPSKAHLRPPVLRACRSAVAFVAERIGNNREAAALALAAILFLLNDFVLVADGRLWLLADYGVRLLVLWACLAAASPDALRLGRPPSIVEVIAWTILLAAVTFAAERLLINALPQPGLFSYPDILDPLWLGFDTLVGIPLVALSEEVFCRGLFLAWAERRGWGGGRIIVFSSLLFAIIHWSLGPASIIGAGLVGILFMVSLLITRSLWPAILAHWLANLALFSLPRWQYLEALERWSKAYPG